MKDAAVEMADHCSPYRAGHIQERGQRGESPSGAGPRMTAVAVRSRSKSAWMSAWMYFVEDWPPSLLWHQDPFAWHHRTRSRAAVPVDVVAFVPVVAAAVVAVAFVPVVVAGAFVVVAFVPVVDVVDVVVDVVDVVGVPAAAAVVAFAPAFAAAVAVAVDWREGWPVFDQCCSRSLHGSDLGTRPYRISPSVVRGGHIGS